MRGYTYTRLTICLLLLLCIIATYLICISFDNNIVEAEVDPGSVVTVVRFNFDRWRNIMEEWYELHMKYPEDYPYFSKIIIERCHEGGFFVDLDKERDAIVIKYNANFIYFSNEDSDKAVGLFAFEYISPIDNDTYYQHALMNVKEIVGLEHLNFSNITSASSMFRGLSKLESIDLSKQSFYECKDFSYMFYDCSSLKTIKMPNCVYGSKVKDIRGMFYNTALTSLDLTNFAPLSLDKTLDYDPEYTYGLDLYPYFLSPNNKLLSFKMPDNELTQNFNVNKVPESLLNFEFGEFAVDDGEMNICYSLYDMIGYTDTLYRVGEISYVVLYKGKNIVFDSDYYLATRPYTSKGINVYKIQRKISKIMDFNFDNCYWYGASEENNDILRGEIGGELTCMSLDDNNESNTIDTTGNFVIYLSDAGDNELVDVSPEYAPKSKFIDVEKYVVSDGIEEGSPVKSINTLLVIALSMVGVFILILGILAIASARYVDINGKPTLVFITKAGNKYSKCITLNHKKYRVKNRALRKKKNKIDDVVHILNSDKDVEEVPFFKGERF